VKTLHVPNRLIKELSGSLQVQDGESPMDLLPELEELRYDAGRGLSDAFVPFLDLRRNADRPFVLVPIPTLPGRLQTTGSWATWQVEPGGEYTPPSGEPSIYLESELPSPRLFGPRSPRSSF
jgi:hypothetical protein